MKHLASYKSHVILVLLLSVSAPVFAEKPDIELARTYLSHLTEQRMDQARQLMHDDIVFRDPTQGGELAGPDALIKLYEGQWDVEHRELGVFSSNNVVVLSYMHSANLPLPNSSPPETVHVMVRFARVITVRDGKIVVHEDYGDYEEVFKAIQAKTAVDPMQVQKNSGGSSQDG